MRIWNGKKAIYLGRLPPVVPGVFLILAFEVMSRLGFQVVPSVSEVFAIISKSCAEGLLPQMAGKSLMRLFGGMLPALITVVPIGLLIGRIPVLREGLRPIIDFLRAIPVTALFPFFILILGLGDSSKVGMCYWTSALILLVATIDAAETVDDTRLRLLRRLGASRLFLLWHVLFPETLPSLFAGARVALGTSFVIVLASEMFSGTDYGLGAWAYTALVQGDIGALWASILCAGILAVLINWLMSVVERRVAFWYSDLVRK